MKIDACKYPRTIMMRYYPRTVMTHSYVYRLPYIPNGTRQGQVLTLCDSDGDTKFDVVFFKIFNVLDRDFILYGVLKNTFKFGNVEIEFLTSFND